MLRGSVSRLFYIRIGILSGHNSYSVKMLLRLIYCFFYFPCSSCWYFCLIAALCLLSSYFYSYIALEEASVHWLRVILHVVHLAATIRLSEWAYFWNHEYYKLHSISSTQRRITILYNTQVRPRGISVSPDWANKTDFSFRNRDNKFWIFRKIGQVHP